jgi:hypothetical protein
VTAAHRNVPVGTVVDRDGDPVTIRRDYSVLRLPECELYLTELDALRKILDDYETAALACAALGEDDD